MFLVTNYYNIIGVSAQATTAEIKARYRALSKQYHPDAGGSEAHMAQLNQAYAVLSSPLERAAHDRELAREHSAEAEKRKQTAAKANAYAAQSARAQQRAQTQQTHDDEFFAAAARGTADHPKKKSNFWRFMAWGTAAYVVAGLAILYFLTTPTTASSDTAQTTTSSSSATSQEATNASATAEQSSSPSDAATNPTTSSSQDTQPTNTNEQSDQTSTDSQTTQSTDASSQCTNGSATTCQTTTATTPAPKQHTWRRLLHF